MTKRIPGVTTSLSPFERLAPHHLWLRVLDVIIAVQADAPQPLDSLACQYRRFRLEVPPEPEPDLTFVLLTRAHPSGEQPALWSQDQVWPLPAPEQVPARLSLSLFNAVVAQVKTHLLIHAGVVAAQGQGLMLVADSGHGKTTLTVELVRRGFQFLSDESAALSLTDQRLHPFPRALSLRPGSQSLLSLAHPAGTPARLGNKRLLDIDQIRPGALGQPVPPRYVIFLSQPKQTQQIATLPPEISLYLDRLADDFLVDLSRLEGIVGAPHLERSQARVTLHLRSGARYTTLRQIEQLCHHHQVWLLNVVNGPVSPVSFAGPARLEPLPMREAITALLPHYQGGYHSAALREQFNHSPSQLFVSLAAMLAQAQCYRLHLGPLSEMADLVAGLVPDNPL